MNNYKIGLSNILQRYMQDFFMSKNINAYYLTAPKKVDIPYVIYELRHVLGFDDNGQGKVFNLEINAFDEGDGFVINNILDEIEISISNLSDSNNFFSISGNRAYGRIDIVEDEPIKHKRTTLSLRVFESQC